jgi:hypothetical protein
VGPGGYGQEGVGESGVKSWAEMRKELEAQAKNGIAALDPKIIERVKAADDGLKALCEKYQVRAVIVETIQKINGNEAMHGFEITFVPREAVPK